MNVVYPKWKEAIIQGAANSSLAGTVKAYLIDVGSYTYNAAHQFLTDVPSGARIGTAVTLASKTYLAGVFDAADLTFPTVSGTTVEAVIFVIDTGVEATSRLVAYIDSATGLPFTPSGIDQPLVWNVAGIFGF
jgi:hypothetical protein